MLTTDHTVLPDTHTRLSASYAQLRLFGTRYRKLFSIKSRLKTFLFSRAFSFFLLINTLPGPSAS